MARLDRATRRGTVPVRVARSKVRPADPPRRGGWIDKAIREGRAMPWREGAFEREGFDERRRREN